MIKRQTYLVLVILVTGCTTPGLYTSGGRYSAEKTKEWFDAYASDDHSKYRIAQTRMIIWCNKCNPKDAPKKIKTADGSTIMHLAIKKGHKRLISFLNSDYSEVWNIEDNAGKSSLYYLPQDLKYLVPKSLELSFVNIKKDGGSQREVFNLNEQNESQRPSFLKRYGAKIFCGAVLAVIIRYGLKYMNRKQKHKDRNNEEIKNNSK